MQLFPNFKSSSKTKFYHKKLGHLFRIRQDKDSTRAEPQRFVIDPEPTSAPSPKPPVRIFVGTESAQHRAERIFIWSILQVRDPARRYEVYLMKNLKGFDRSDWKTGFTFYRYIIPALAGNSGRAIYNDVDQIYLADPAELFDLDMQGSGQLCITEKETSVMLLDCEKLSRLWQRKDAESGKRHKFFREKVQSVAGMWNRLPNVWNARDQEYEPGVSRLLHFTTLQTQPWKPFPDVFHYQEHDHGKLWLDMEQAADTAGFTVFSESHPSPGYLHLVEMYKTMHEEGTPKTGRPAEKTFPGKSLREHVEPIAALIKETGAKSLLDYGSGKAKLYAAYPGEPEESRFKSMPEWDGVKVTCYDPGYEPFSGPIEPAYDAVISTDVLEHITEEDIPWVLDKLFRHAQKFVYVVAACYPAKKCLPDGQNAHCTVQSPEWWNEQVKAASRRNPGIRWQLCTQSKGKFGMSDKIYNGGFAV